MSLIFDIVAITVNFTCLDCKKTDISQYTCELEQRHGENTEQRMMRTKYNDTLRKTSRCILT